MKFVFRLFLVLFLFSYGFTFFNVKKKYHIGCLLPLNEEYRTFSKEILKGLLLGLKILKSSDLTLTIYNTEGDPIIATQAIEEMAKNGYKMAIALLGKKTTFKVVNKAKALNLPLLVLSTEDSPLGEGIYRDFLTPKIEVENLLNFAMEKLGLSSFAIFYPDDEYGQKFANLFKETVKKREGTIVAMMKYSPKATDFGHQIKALIGNEIAEAKPEEILKEPPQFPFEAVFIPDVYLTSAFIISQFAYYNARNLIFLGTSLWSHPKFAIMIKGNCQTAYYPTSFTLQAKQPWVQEFIAEFRKTYQTFPNYLSAQGYDVGRIISYLKELKALNLKNAYQFIQNFPGVTGMTTFLPNGETKKKIYIMEIKDGIVKLIS